MVAMMKRPPLRFSIFTIAVAGSFAMLAWTTQLRAALHAGLISLCVFAFLPFVIVAAILGVMFAVGLVLGFATGGDVDASDLAGFAESLVYAPRGARVYYRFLARHSRSIWLAVPAGLLAGTLITWGLLAVFVVPHELRTTAILLQARSDIDRHYAQTKQYPAPLGDAFLATPDGQPLVDDFDHKLRYEIQGVWLAKSYRLVSYGADGVPSEDDLCVQGQTKLQRALDTSAALVSLTNAVVAFKTGVRVRDQLSAYRALQCENGYVAPRAQTNEETE
jgi:hypothetical protein